MALDYPLRLQEPQILPDLLLPSSTGREISPRQYRQRNNLVLLFFGADGVRCRALLADLGARYGEYRDLDTEVLAITGQPPGTAERLAHEMRLPFPVLSDPNHRLLGKGARFRPPDGSS